MLRITLKAISRTITVTRIKFSKVEMYSEHNGVKKHIKHVPWISYMVIEKDHCNEIRYMHMSLVKSKNHINKQFDFWKRQYGGKINYEFRTVKKQKN